MRINLLSSFAAGILIATSICGVVYFNTNSEGTKPAAQISENDMKAMLETKGYVVETKAAYNKKLEAAKSVVPNQTAPKQTAPKQTVSVINKNGKTVTQVVFSISPGMTSFDVGQSLAKASMVKSALAFSRSIHQKGLEKNLRPGTFVVDSSMTYDQIVSTIFKN